MSNQDKNQPRPSRLLAYLRLFRLPNVFTAVADITMGFFFVRQSLDPPLIYFCLLFATALMYTAGMVLNDVYDVEVDRQERPFRPLPSGQISLGWATWLGYEMLLLGVALAWLAGLIHPGEVATSWKSGVLAVCLAVCILLYNGVLKKTILGPVAMGGCRFLNLLMGMSIAAAASPEAVLLGFDLPQLAVAGGIGVYIAGITWFARGEAAESKQRDLVAGIVLMAAGFLLLALFPQLSPAGSPTSLKNPLFFQLLVLLLAVTVLRRCLVTAFNPRPERVQGAVKNCILSLIVMDASVVLAVKPSEPYWAIGVVALLLPTLVLGKWVYST